MLSRIRWPKDFEPISDESLERPFQDHEADKFGHPLYEDLMSQHISDNNPHKIEERKSEIIRKHEEDKLAHRNLFNKYFYQKFNDHIFSENSHKSIVDALVNLLYSVINFHTHQFLVDINKIKEVSELPKIGIQGEFVYKDGYFYLWFNGKWHKYKLVSIGKDIRKYHFFFEDDFDRIDRPKASKI